MVKKRASREANAEKSGEKEYLSVKNITHLPHGCVFVAGRIP